MDLKQRCNNLFECSDRSDEDNCEPLLIDNRNYRIILPPELEKKKTEIFVHVELHGITDIDQISMTFRGDIRLRLQWRDPRLKFKDLGSNETFLNKHWLDQIWLPPLILSNTIGNVPISRDEPVVVKILKQGPYVHNDITDLHEGTLFLGNENDLQLDGEYEHTFKCLFELKRFPFDTQNCSVNIKIPHEIKKYIKLKPRDLNLKGE